MRVGILTFPNSISYGATLQMHALQQAVTQMGHDAEVIHYHNPYMRAEKHLLRRKKVSAVKAAVQRMIRLLMHHRLYGGFRRFERRHNPLYPLRPFTRRERLTKLGKRYGAVICGSDQVWNPRITDGDLSYFLDFCTADTKRISYAASFGLNTVPEEFQQAIRPDLMQFSALSVRELSGQALLEQMLEQKVTMVSDPTFLLEPSDWVALERPHKAAVGEYVLYFAVNHSDKLFGICRDFAHRHGMKMVVVGGNPLKVLCQTRNAMVEYAADVRPDEWLYLIHHARYVFTNSFHGTAFSVILQKDFYVEYPQNTSCRLAQVLADLGLESRVVREGMDLPEEAIFYDAVQPKLQRMREHSRRFLQESLQD